MKKLLLSFFLLFCVVKISYSKDVLYLPVDNQAYGDDGSYCYEQNQSLWCDNGENFPLTTGQYIYGSKGSSCYFQGDYLYCDIKEQNKSKLGYTSTFGDNAKEAGSILGKGIVESFGGTPSNSSNSSGESGNKWEKIISNALSSNPTYGN